MNFLAAARSAAAFIGLALCLSTIACRESASSYLERGNRALAEGNLKEADIAFRRAAKAGANKAQVLYRRGIVRLEQKKVFEAYTYLSQAAAGLPDNIDLHVRLADLSLGLYTADPNHSRTFYDRADRIASRLLSRDTNSFDGLRLKASLLAVDGKHQEAEKMFHQADAIKPGQPQVRLGLIQTLMASGQLATARQLGHDLVKSSPRFNPAYDALYRSYVQTGEIEKAVTVLQTKVHNSQASLASLVELADHFAARSQWKEAEDVLQRIVNKNTQDGPAAAAAFYARYARHDKAIEHYRRAIQVKPAATAEFEKQIARSYMSINRPADAMNAVDSVLKRESADEEAQLLQAELWLQSGSKENISRAKEKLTALVAAEPTDVERRIALAQAQIASGNFAAARKELASCLRANPAMANARSAAVNLDLSAGRPRQALVLAEEGLAINAADPQLRLAKATSLIRIGSFSQARAELNSLEKDFPNQPGILHQRGALALAEKKLTDAEAILRRLRKEHPDNIEATAGLSQVLLAQKRSEEALATLREHVTAHPQSSRVRYLLATAAMRLQRFDLAVENYRAVLKSNPDQPAMVIELARALFGLRDFVEAEKVLKPVLERDARNAAAHALLATTLEQTGQLDRAKLHYQKAVDLQIEEPTVYNNLAWLIAETGGDLELAQRLSTKAVQRAAHRADYKDTLAWVYLKKNEVPAALHIWKQLVASDGKHAIYRYHYALALAKSGNAPAARLQLKQALANAPAGPVRHEITKILQNI